MRILKMAMIALVLSTGFLACKKDSKNDNASDAVRGTYAGKYGYGNDVPDLSYILKVSEGGIFQELDHTGDAIGQGTWHMNGNTLTATYSMLFAPHNTYSVSATFNASTQKLIGTWGYDNNPADGGKIDMAKQ